MGFQRPILHRSQLSTRSTPLQRRWSEYEVNAHLHAARLGAVGVHCVASAKAVRRRRECQHVLKSIWVMLVGDQLLLMLNTSKIEIAPLPLVDRNNLANASLRPLGRWLVHTIDRQERYGVLNQNR